MKDDRTDHLLRDVAASGLIAAIHPASPEWENDPSFSLSKLPVDPHPWFGGAIEIKVPLPRGRGWTKAPFLFWTANGDVLWVGSVFHGSGPAEVGFSLMDAIVAPMFGEPRRPAKVCLQNEAMATALRDSAATVGCDIPAIVEIAVKPSPQDVERATAFLNGHAERLAEEQDD